MKRARPIAISLFILIALGSGLLWSRVARDSRITVRRSQLIALLGPVRPIEGRLLGFSHSTYPTPPAVNASKLFPVVRSIEGLVQRTASSSAVADLAMARLSLGKKDEAILLLERATHQKAEAWIWSDLSALYLERARSDNPLDLLRALDAAQLAVGLDGSLRPARFNLALALEKNLLSQKAIEAWSKVVRMEGASPWGIEARSHVEGLWTALSAPTREAQSLALESAVSRGHPGLDQIVDRAPGLARKHGEEVVTERWASAVANGQTAQAQRHLEAMARLGAALARRGEPMLSDFVFALQASQLRGNPPRQAAEEQLALARGRLLCRDGQGSEGSTLIKHARDFFQRDGNPEWMWASLSLSVCLYTQSEYGSALSSLDALAREGVERYPSLQAKIQWIRGMCLLATEHPSEALTAYRAAREIYLATFAKEDLAATEYLISEALRYLGEERESWQTLYRGIALAVQEGDVWRQYAAFDEVADAAAKDGLPWASLAFRERVVEIARLTPDPPSLTHALMRRGEAFLALGRGQQAKADLGEALALCRKIADPAVRRRRQADVLFALGKLNAIGNPGKAIAFLDEAQQLYRQHDELPLVDTFTERAAVLMRQGKSQLAMEELEAGTKELESRRSSIHDADSRITFFEQSRRLFETRIALEAVRPEVAFSTVERFRARSLLDRLVSDSTSEAGSQQVAEPLSSSSIRESLPTGAVLVEFVVLPHEILTWTITRDGLSFRRVSSSSADLSKAVSRFCGELRAARSVAEGAGLYDLLIAPLREELRSDSFLIIVPDGPLHGLPFAALQNKENGRFLVEEFQISLAASGSTLALSLRRERHRAQGELRLLAVGNPAFSRAQYPDLRSLPGAEREAQAIAALYGRHAQLLTGGTATVRAVLARTSGSTIIHMAAHARYNESSPGSSEIILASESRSGAGQLRACDLEASHLADTRLAVLSACGTARSSGLHAEGSMALSRSLLAAGVPSVVGSLWDMNDAASYYAMVAFHQGILQGKSPAAALRSAQREMMRSDNPAIATPGSWAGLQVVGGLLPVVRTKGDRDGLRADD